MNNRDETMLIENYQSPNRWAQWLVICIGVVAIVSMVSVISDLMERDLVVRFVDSNPIAQYNLLDDLKASDQRQNVINWIQLGSFIISAVFFLKWFHRTYRNLSSFGMTMLTYSPRWTWLGFVVPFVNFVRPYQVASEIWTCSEPNMAAYQGKVAPIVKLWWGSFLVMNLLGRVLTSLYRNLDTAEQVFSANAASILFDFSYIVASAFAIAFIVSLTRRQEEKRASLANAALPTTGT